MPLNLILAESALELVPGELCDHPSVTNLARKRGKRPGQVLLDRSYHHAAILAAKSTDFSKRGRPDIVHVCLLQALDSPVNREGRLHIYVHTVNGVVISVSPKVRIPRNYMRFVGLMEQLLANGRVPSEGEALLTVQQISFPRLLESIGPSPVIGLSSSGRLVSLEELGKRLTAQANTAVVVGGFPRGSFSQSVMDEFDELFSIYKEGLEAWTVVTRVLYSFEAASS